MTSPGTCPFCSLPADRILVESSHHRAVADGFPLAAGHTLIIPKRHVASVFDLTSAEWEDLWALVRRVRADLPALQGADGMNLGLNDGRAAGQTIEHAHVHLIPRTRGDVADPRGGVRWVIPERADYWSGGRDDERT